MRCEREIGGTPATVGRNVVQLAELRSNAGQLRAVELCRVVTSWMAKVWSSVGEP